MRKELKYILWGHFVLVVFLFYCTYDLISLLFDNPFPNSFVDMELNPIDGKFDKPPLIPKIIHQTYKTEVIPESWRPGQQACVDLHPDYQYILWTDEMSRDFIAEKYPWFLQTWDDYPYPIQRADAIRYFALAHYGGIYIDLDDGCLRRLDPLLTAPAFLRVTQPTGISNDVMGAVQGHPFFVKAIENLQRYSRSWIVPYITIMFSTGPLFLSVMLMQYKRKGMPEAGKVKVLLPEAYKAKSNSFFSIAPGSSWHLDDAKWMKFMARHIALAVLGGFLVAGLIFILEWWFYQWCIHTNFAKHWDKLKSKLRIKSKKSIKKRSRKDLNLPVNLDFEKIEPVETV